MVLLISLAAILPQNVVILRPLSLQVISASFWLPALFLSPFSFRRLLLKILHLFQKGLISSLSIAFNIYLWKYTVQVDG